MSSRRRPAPDRALETAALVPVALGALLAHAGAAEAGTGGGQPGLKAGAKATVSLEDALAAGRGQIEAGRVVEALQAYHQALSQAPESIEALNAVAVCYDRLGKFDSSRTYYEMALGIDPQSPLLLNNYGYSLYLQGDRAGATRFLALAVATGEADVQATALRVLARIEAEGRAVDNAGAAPVAAVQQAAAERPPAAAGAQIVRTSAHEVRLVLGDVPPPSVSSPAGARRLPFARPVVAPMPVAPAILADALGPSAAAILPVAAFSADEERMIAQAEAAAIRREAMAAAIQAQRDAQALSAAPSAAVPAMMQAMLDLALGARPVPASATSIPGEIFAPKRPGLPAASDPEWARYQLLVAGKAPAAGKARDVRTAAARGLLVAGLSPAPPELKTTPEAPLPAAEPITRKRAFEQPFTSDDQRLNRFAGRMQGVEDAPAVEEQVARLQALIARTARA